MPKPAFTVQPQRYNGRAWVACEAHRAQQWAVIRRQGRKVKSVVARYSTKAQAEAIAVSEAIFTAKIHQYHQSRYTIERLGLSYSTLGLDEDDTFLRSL